METIFALLITVLLATSTLYLLIAYVIIPLIKISKDYARLKQK
ncbi:MAG: hypothetical protein ACOX2X_03695 [Peptococcia bacterium]|jgi:antibiotic biosynthesis monooxygenase (ABM) superfamily enzyme